MATRARIRRRRAPCSAVSQPQRRRYMAVKTERADCGEVAPASRQAAAAAASETSRCRAWMVGEQSAKAPTTRPMGGGYPSQERTGIGVLDGGMVACIQAASMGLILGRHGGSTPAGKPACGVPVRSLRPQRVASGAPMEDLQVVKVLGGAPLDCAREPSIWNQALPPRLQRGGRLPWEQVGEDATHLGAADDARTQGVGEDDVPDGIVVQTPVITIRGDRS
mmetsp:Transcript_54253/g.161089  ORF Transcript_54253/g.161089 Transcript_54253/m.161089 type:complete len:222 (-) Transcript_54253:479-1144(-)